MALPETLTAPAPTTGKSLEEALAGTPLSGILNSRLPVKKAVGQYYDFLPISSGAVRVTNSITLESAIFATSGVSVPHEVIADPGSGNGSHPTLPDPNPHHEIILPSNPAKLTEEQIKGYLASAFEWFLGQYRRDKLTTCPAIVLNVRWNDQTTNPGYMKLLMSTRGHFPPVEKLKAAAEAYSNKGSSIERNYFLLTLPFVQGALGLAFECEGSTFMADLTPRGEKGVMVIRRMASWGSHPDLMEQALQPGTKVSTWTYLPGLAGTVKFLLDDYREMGAKGCVATIILPSLLLDNGWARFPAIIRAVEGTQAIQDTAEMGYLGPLLVTPVVSTDPFSTTRTLEKFQERVSPYKLD